MLQHVRLSVIGLLIGSAFAHEANAFLALQEAPPAAAKHYVCPPCGCESDAKSFAAPGACPSCGMALAEKKGPADEAAPQPPAGRKNVAILVHEGVELLDFAGPGEVFAAARTAAGPAFNVYTVASSTQPIVSQRFVRITPQYSFDDCPKPHIVVLPGGATNLALRDAATMKWIKETAPDAEIMLSVCTGAFLLAEVGLLDSLEATTHWGSINGLKQAAPRTRVVADRRFVDNGKIITSAGVSAGIDSSLHVVARLLGQDAARQTARYMEYNWQPVLPAAPAPAGGAPAPPAGGRD